MDTKISGIKHYFYVQNLAFTALGFDVTAVERTWKRPLLTMPFVLSMLLLLVSWIHLCLFYLNSDFEKFADSLIPLCQGIICVGKFFNYFFKQPELQKLILRIGQLTERANREELSIICAENDIDKMFSTIYFLTLNSQIFFISVIPMVRTLVIYAQTDQIQLYLPFEISTPFDVNHIVYYMLTAFWVFCATYCFAYAAISVDTLYSWSVHNISAQFRLLKLLIRTAAAEPLATRTEAGIGRFIAQHQKVIDLAVDFDFLFRPVLLLEFLLNGLQLCFIAFRLIRGVPTENLPFLFVFFGSVTFQLMIYCYGGQRIKDESSNVCSYIYELFPWHSISICARKMLHLSIIRTQKCCCLTGIFFTADWLMFVWVFSKAYSFLTLLFAVVSNE